jgi:hypothetical protein
MREIVTALECVTSWLAGDRPATMRDAARRSTRLRGLAVSALSALCAAAGLLALGGAPAQALSLGNYSFSSSFGSDGSEVGQFSAPTGVAVDGSTSLADASSGDVYVADPGNDRVEKFNAEGDPVPFTATGSYIDGSWLTGTPGGSFTAPTFIAVDSSTNPLDPSAGDVYVVDETVTAPDLTVIDKYSSTGAYIGQLTDIPETQEGNSSKGVGGIAIDPEGRLWVARGYGHLHQFGAAALGVDEYNSAPVNEYLGETEYHSVAGFPYQGPALAVDSNDDLYRVIENGDVEKYASQDIDLGTADSCGCATGLAINEQNDDLYVDTGKSVEAYSATGSRLAQPSFGSGNLTGGSGLAVDPTNGNIYVVDSASDAVDIFTTVIVPDVTTGVATNADGSSATLTGVVDPDNLPLTGCEFQYGTDTTYSSGSVPCATAPSGGSPTPVTADLTGLEAGVLYHFRLVASNADGVNYGQDRVIPTLASVAGETIADVSAGAATLQAEINPAARDTTYYFQYGTDASYGTDAPAPPGIDIGSGEVDRSVRQHLQDLEPATTYHYRVVAINQYGTSVGPDETFTTEPASVPFLLPDGRAYEMVSPAQKNGAYVFNMGGFDKGGLPQASEAGDAMTYLTNTPIAGPTANPASSQIFGVRGPGGWSAEDIASPNESYTGIASTNGTEYRAFSEDLSAAIIQQSGDVFANGGGPATRLTADAPALRTLYRRDNQTGALQTLTPASIVPAGTEEAAFEPEFAGASPDLEHVLFTTSVALTGNAAHNVRANNLYEWNNGSGVSLVNVLPDETTWEGGAVLGDGGNVIHAVSEDGARVIWTDVDYEFQTGHGGTKLYQTDMVTHKTVQLDAPRGGTGSGNGIFRAANSSGSLVFLTDQEPLTAGSEAHEKSDDLYVFDASTGDLTDLTPIAGGGGVQGVLGASEDGSYIYFTANGVLAPGATPGSCGCESSTGKAVGPTNLYVAHLEDGQWSTKFIATLAGADGPDWGSGSSSFSPTSRVTPDGLFVAFMSSARIPTVEFPNGYDNLDANSGQPDEEVYLYDLGSERMSCASCNPTGALPVGELDAGNLSMDPIEYGNFTGTWLAAAVPPISPLGVSGDGTYQSRYLSDEGRLFFDSRDGLVAHDTNEKEDVYEFEPGGVGSCVTATGCVSLISSGIGSEDSTFLDASANGSNVFFRTSDQLLPQDLDDSFDVYDARMCTAAEPCIASGAVAPPPCASSDACKAGPTPQPAIFGAPPSATFAGAGNVAAPAPAAKETAKKQVGSAKKQARSDKRHKQRKKKQRAGRQRKKQQKAERAKTMAKRATGRRK